MNTEYLDKIIDTFVVKQKRPRLRELYASSRRYLQFQIELLHDPRNFDPTIVERLAPIDQNPAGVYRILRAYGADDIAYLVGDCDPYDDGTIGPLRDLVEACVDSQDDALVYCPSANVAYYEGHESFRYILRRASVASSKRRSSP